MRNALILGLATLALIGAAGFWLMQPKAEALGEGVVVVGPAPVAASSPAPTAGPVLAELPSPPDKVIAQVRQAYPLLSDVDFACEAGGCAVTATIPPPTGDAFLEKRQEMLTGGLARLIAANGYRTTGPVQMDEVAFNTFHIRAAVVRPEGR